MSKQSYEGSPDKRIIRMKITSGVLKEEDLQEYLHSLPDLSAHAEPIATEPPPGATDKERKERPAS